MQELFARGRIGYRDFNNHDNFDGRGDEPVDGDLDRGYYRLDVRRYNQAYGRNLFGVGDGDANITFQGGRDLVYWANGLVLAQVLDGVEVDLVKGPIDVQFIAGVTPVRSVDFDTSRPAFYYNTHRGFFGGMLSAQVGDARPFVYGLIQRDYNTDNTLSQGTVNTRFSYNSYYLGVGAAGTIGDHLRYGFEAAYETGNGLSNSFVLSPLGGLEAIDQTRDTIIAMAGDAKVDYLVNDAHQTRYGLEVIVASGDSDRGSATNTFNGNRPGTKDNGFNAFGLLNTGLAFAPSVSNLLAVRVGASTFPLPEVSFFQHMQVGTDVFIFSKLQSLCADRRGDEPAAFPWRRARHLPELATDQRHHPGGAVWHLRPGQRRVRSARSAAVYLHRPDVLLLTVLF